MRCSPRNSFARYTSGWSCYCRESSPKVPSSDFCSFPACWSMASGYQHGRTPLGKLRQGGVLCPFRYSLSIYCKELRRPCTPGRLESLLPIVIRRDSGACRSTRDRVCSSWLWVIIERSHRRSEYSCLPGCEWKGTMLVLAACLPPVQTRGIS